MGRFEQRDPLGYVDGMNLYEYVGGNPTNKIDSRGTQIEDEGGDGIIGRSYRRTIAHKTDDELVVVRYSFFEPYRSINAGDIKDLEQALALIRAKFELIVRVRTSTRMLTQALNNCDKVYLVAHGLDRSPYVKLNRTSDWEFPLRPKATCWIGACRGRITADRLNSREGASNSYSSMPASVFDSDNTVIRTTQIKQLIIELDALRKSGCAPGKAKICVLAGYQQIEDELKQQ
jgi:hypothetical protein